MFSTFHFCFLLKMLSKLWWGIWWRCAVVASCKQMRDVIMQQNHSFESASLVPMTRLFVCFVAFCFIVSSTIRWLFEELVHCLVTVYFCFVYADFWIINIPFRISSYWWKVILSAISIAWSLESLSLWSFNLDFNCFSVTVETLGSSGSFIFNFIMLTDLELCMCTTLEAYWMSFQWHYSFDS